MCLNNPTPTKNPSEGESQSMLKLSMVTLYVRDEEEALRFYTEKLGFEKQMDVTVKPGTRWLTVSPKGQPELQITLHNPRAWHSEEVALKMLEQVGSTPSWVFETDNCQRTYETLRNRGVEFVSEPKDQSYAVEAVFKDLYGNSFVLVERK